MHGGALEAMNDLYVRLIEIADDYELVTIEEVAERAGIIWKCPDEDCRWINREDDLECRNCPRLKP